MSEFRIGKFQILATLGTGAHSTILHVRRTEDGKSYALKVVPIAGGADQKFLVQAQHEFRIAQMLDHPNLIKVYALELVKDWLFRVRKVHLLIEYVNGKTLNACPAIPIPKLVQIFKCVADGLVHRCLSFNALERPERMSEVQAVLDRLADKLVRSADDRLEALEW